MNRSIVFAVPKIWLLLLAGLGFFSFSAYANDAPMISDSVKAGGLSCFSMTPAVDPQKGAEYPTCDALCAAQGAACTGMENGAMNPPTKCSDLPPPGFAVCRCCRVAP